MIFPPPLPLPSKHHHQYYKKLQLNVCKYLEDFGKMEVFLMIVFRCENWDVLAITRTCAL